MEKLSRTRLIFLTACSGAVFLPVAVCAVFKVLFCAAVLALRGAGVVAVFALVVRGAGEGLAGAAAVVVVVMVRAVSREGSKTFYTAFLLWPLPCLAAVT
ncbi:MAG: hypothetical protein ACOY95_14515 [Pseudomonadota bacterium]